MWTNELFETLKKVKSGPTQLLNDLMTLIDISINAFALFSVKSWAYNGIVKSRWISLKVKKFFFYRDVLQFTKIF